MSRVSFWLLAGACGLFVSGAAAVHYGQPHVALALGSLACVCVVGAVYACLNRVCARNGGAK